MGARLATENPYSERLAPCLYRINTTEVLIMFQRKFNEVEIKEDCAIIKIQNNLKGELDCLIDLEDLDKVIPNYFWNVRVDKRHPECTVYVETHSKGKRIHLHRLITNCAENMVVDHINGNGLDNRKENLRVVSQSKNCLNRNKKFIKNNGIHYNKRDNLYIVSNFIMGKSKYFGYYRTMEEALAKRKEIDYLIDVLDINALLKLKCEKVKPRVTCTSQDIAQAV